MYRVITGPVVAGIAMPLTALAGVSTAEAATVLTPSNIIVSTPSGSNDTSNPYTDDVLLDSLTFDGTVYDGTQGSFSAVSRFEVLTGRGGINAEWGDTDDGSDGDDTPFAKAGYPDADQETTDPTIQDAALLNAFNSRSLSEITDGEGSSGQGGDEPSSFKVEFAQSLSFDDVGNDGLPDVLFFERGMNDIFDVELITGGTFENPVYSDTVRINSGDFVSAGFSINTVEIANAQEMGVGGFDLADFGLGSGDTAFGFRLAEQEGTGPDLGGFFLSAEDPEIFGPPLSVAAVPLPASLWMLLGGLGLGFGALRMRRSG